MSTLPSIREVDGWHVIRKVHRWRVPGPVERLAQFNAGGTAVVGSYPPNKFGLSDMHGNVAEWVQDCWNDTYRGAPTDGSAWTTGECGRRVVRGGAWMHPQRYLRAAYRDANSSDARGSLLGFRLARTLGAADLLAASRRLYHRTQLGQTRGSLPLPPSESGARWLPTPARKRGRLGTFLSAHTTTVPTGAISRTWPPAPTCLFGSGTRSI
jgi:hypothetical protein